MNEREKTRKNHGEKLNLKEGQKIKDAALRWLAKNYVDSREAYANLLDYIPPFKRNKNIALPVIGKSYYSEHSDFHRSVALFIHEAVEATEIKKRCGVVKRRAGHKILDYAHPIASVCELKYLLDVGRQDLVEETIRREWPYLFLEDMKKSERAK